MTLTQVVLFQLLQSPATASPIKNTTNSGEDKQIKEKEETATTNTPEVKLEESETSQSGSTSSNTSQTEKQISNEESNQVWALKQFFCFFFNGLITHWSNQGKDFFRGWG